MTALAACVPHAPFEQSRRPRPKLGLLHRQYASGLAQPSWEYWACMFLKHVWPQLGRDDRAVVDVDVTLDVVVTLDVELVVGLAVDEVVCLEVDLDETVVEVATDFEVIAVKDLELVGRLVELTGSHVPKSSWLITCRS